MTYQATTLKRLCAIPALLALAACTDGATRIAYDIEAGASAFERSAQATYVIKHVPEAMPDGGAGAYSVQLSAASSLVVWCRGSPPAGVVSSHATTYHLRFVTVPQTYKLDKPAAEPLYIELRKQAGKPVVVGLR